MTNQKGLSVIVVIVLGIIILGVLYIGYLSFQKYAYYSSLQQNAIKQKSEYDQKNSLTVPSPAIQDIPSENIETITVQDDYQFNVKIPAGYTLKKGMGDYSGFIVNSEGQEIIGFQRSTGGGEGSPLPPEDKVIDGVRFKEEGKNQDCPLSIYPKQQRFPAGEIGIDQVLYFGFVTWCEDNKETQSAVFDEVFMSIKFNDKLRNVLLGIEEVPLIKY